MTCRQFHRHWSARPTGELPPAMQQHLAACPACAAMAHADAATDASLRQLAAVPPPADVDLARAAIIQKLQTETDRPPLECGSLLPLFSLSRLKTRAGGTRTPSLQSGEPFPSHYSGESGVKPPHSKEAGLPRAPWLTGNQRLVWAAAGLTATAVAAALLLRPDETPRPERPRTIVNEGNRPGPSPQNPRPPIGLPQRKPRPQVVENRRPSGTNTNLQPAMPQLVAGTMPRVAPAPPERSAPDGTRRVVPDTPRLTPGGRLPMDGSTPGSWIQVTTALPPSPRSASEGERGRDLLWLNEGPLTDAQPAAPRPPAVPVVAAPPPVQERRPGSVLVDDLLHLNPVRVAAADEESLGAGLRALAGQDPTTDARLQQKVTVHATDERLSDLLAALSKATGVTLMARLEVADERVSLWTGDRPLIDVMRDLRHLRGLYWSRSKRDGEWVYSLWQDAQSLAREEADLQRWAIDQQRKFTANIQLRVQALSATDEALQRLAREEPYLIVQMKHPVIREAYQLFASLTPDQQAQLTQARTPSRGMGSGQDLSVFPLRSLPGDTAFTPPDTLDELEPRGDIVILDWSEMTAAQRATIQAVLRGAAARLRAEGAREKERDPGRPQYGELLERRAGTIAAADPATSTVTFFRWGGADYSGLNFRLDIKSSGRAWAIYSNIGGPPGLYRDTVEKGNAGNIPGATPEAVRLLTQMAKQGAWQPAPAAPVFDPEPDPILDAALSFTWTLPLRGDVGPRHYFLTGDEVMAALHREIGRPLILDGPPPRGLQQDRSAGALFRWEKRPVRELLARFFPGWRGVIREGALFLQDPQRLNQRLHQVPRAVVRFLDEKKGMFTLEDMVLLARALSPWQIVKLREYLPGAAIDELLAAQELLRLYGELSSEQQAALPRGLPFSTLTPPQQALFLLLAQRHRPYLEAWRLQQSRLQVDLGPSPISHDGRGGPARSVSRALFRVQFGEEHAQTFAVDLFPVTGRVGWNAPLSALVGKPFPGFRRNNRSMPGDNTPAWQPALNDPRLQSRTAVIAVARPYVEPYVGTRPPPSTVAWAQTLAARLQPAGIPVAHLTVGAGDAGAGPDGHASAPNLIRLHEPGDANGEPFDSANLTGRVPESPTVFVVDRGGIVRAVFEGPAAWDTAAIERAARVLTPTGAATR
jgi:hypothetical protein